MLFGDISIFIISVFCLPVFFKFKFGLEFFKLGVAQILFVFIIPIFQSVPERTEGLWVNSTVAVLLAFVASRISFRFKIRELASHAIILQQKEELIAEKAKSEEATKNKNEFIANMSHEVQSQMNGVIGILQLLDGTKLSEEQKEYVTILDSSVKNLLTLISDILDFTRMEAGNTELEHNTFELSDLIKEILSISSSIASLNNNVVRSSISPNVPKYISGDKIRLSQILLNLLGNAIKFTKSGRIDLIVTVKEKKDLNLMLEFEVRDSGIGIPTSRIDTIFEMYTKGEISSSKKYKGTGLGLAISKRLVEMMHGHIGVNSIEGKGSSFHFTILTEDCNYLLEKNTPISEPILEQKKIEVNLRKIPLRILLVDDNEINIKLGKKVFEKLGYNVKTAYDGMEAVDSCQKNEFDIIFMDLRMPVLNGFEATELINKTKKNTTDKPLIIALTANANNIDREKCLKLGMVDFVTKPLDVSRIKDYIFHIIEKYNLNH
jgi:signal transduction histidine kinase/ActR/RegA family two-component response regulator